MRPLIFHLKPLQRVAVAEALLNRGRDRPTQFIAGGEDHEPVKLIVSWQGELE